MSIYGHLLTEGFFFKKKSRNNIKQVDNKKFISISQLLAIREIKEFCIEQSKNSNWDTAIKSELSKIDEYNPSNAPRFIDKPYFSNKSNNSIQFSCYTGSMDGLYKVVDKYATELEHYMKKENKFVKEAYSLEDYPGLITVDLKEMKSKDSADYILDKVNEIVKVLFTTDYKKSMADKLNEYMDDDKYSTANDIQNIIKPRIFDNYVSGDFHHGIIEIIDGDQDEAIALSGIIKDIISELNKLPELESFKFTSGDGDEGCIYY